MLFLFMLKLTRNNKVSNILHDASLHCSRNSCRPWSPAWCSSWPRSSSDGSVVSIKLHDRLGNPLASHVVVSSYDLKCHPPNQLVFERRRIEYHGFLGQVSQELDRVLADAAVCLQTERNETPVLPVARRSVLESLLLRVVLCVFKSA